METVNIFNQMARYDFNTPINATMIFEDTDEDNIDGNEIKFNNKKVQVITENANQENNVINEMVVVEDETASNLEENQTLAPHQNDSSILKENTQTINSQKSTLDVTNADKPMKDINSPSLHSINCGDMINDSHKLSKTSQQISDKEELTTYVKDLLNTLSEHIILVIKYHYYHQNRNITPQISAQLHTLKSHFFNLSYSILVSIIIPQENNELFVKAFIDKTLSDANKVFLWKCERQHVERFYKEMVEWAKVKKNVIESLRVRRKNNNSILGKHLAKPPLPPNFPNRTTGFNQHEKMVNNNNSQCIFSTDAPGGKISINVDTETLQKHAGQTQQKNLIVKRSTTRTQRKRNSIHSPDIQPVQMHYDHNHSTHLQQNDYLQNNLNSLQQKFPQNNENHFLLQNNYNKHNSHMQQNYYSQNSTDYYNSMLPRLSLTTSSQLYTNTAANPQMYPHTHNQIQENIIHSMQHAQTQRNISPNNNTFISQSSAAPACNDSQFTQNLVVNDYIGEVTNMTPIITNVRSLSQAAYPSYPAFIRCRICGQNTNLRGSKYNEHYYCSILCQELDSGVHRAS